MARLLMIEDDRALAGLVRDYLGRAGLTLEHRPDAQTGLAAAIRGGYDAILLDLMLPDGDGLELCRAIRARSDVPILMLTARGEDADRIVGLEIGADDYLPKPFNPRELLARLRAVLRRRAGGNGAASGEVLRFGRLTIDRAARRVLVDSEERVLTGHQFDLLYALAENGGPGSHARAAHGPGARPGPGGLRPKHRRAHIEDQGRDRGRSGQAAPHRDPAGCRLSLYP